MKFASLFFVVCFLIGNSLAMPFNLRTKMTVEEIIEMINGELLPENHSFWRSPVVIKRLGFLKRDKLRLIQANHNGEEYCLAIELDHSKTLKNLFYVSLNDTWFECHATFIGDYWTVFNQVKVGDDYDEVITRIGQSVSSDFYCGSGVWYIRYFYRFENQLGMITFFAATGKVAHVGHVYPGYTGYRMIEHENGDVEFYID
jgi:hypothetical protein